MVGYTNAGKSTLFNLITKADVFAKDMLFATLDPTLRKIELRKGQDIIVSDTVGFISNLPHELVMAFRATLEEVLEADVIVHVIDASNPDSKTQRQDVLDVLHELGLSKIEHEPNYIEVFNKTDKLDAAAKARLAERISGNTSAAAVSALSGEGTERLMQLLQEKICAKGELKTVSVPVGDGKRLAEVYRTAEVLEWRDDGERIYLRVRC